MSTNITTCNNIECDAWIDVKKLRKLQRKYDNCQLGCEACFLEDMDPSTADENGLVKVESVYWYGEFSGSNFECDFLKKIVPHIIGNVNVVFVWEGGQCGFTGLKIKDGTYEEYDVIFGEK